MTYKGRLGNKLGEYCVGRIIAEGLRFDLDAAPIPGFPNVRSLGDPVRPATEPSQCIGEHRIDIGRIVSDKTPRHIILNGFFQRYEYFRAHKTPIRDSWLVSDVGKTAAPDDLTIHVRAGDVWQINTPRRVHPEYHALPLSFYESILRSRRWSKVTIVTEDRSDLMVQRLVARTGADVQSVSVLDDFNVMRASSNLVLSVSSYAWWAGWLSDARRIFFPVAGIFDQARVQRRRAASQQDLWVDDEPRYIAMRPVAVDRQWTGTEEDRQRLLNS